MGYLYRFEIKGIQNFIFSTNKMREIAGGSAIIDTMFTPKDWGLKEIEQSAAGSATIYFEDKQFLEKFASEFPRYAQYCAPTVELVQAWVPFDKNSPKEQTVIEDLLDKLTYARNQKTVSLPEMGPLLLRDRRTGQGVIDPKTKKYGARSFDAISLAKERPNLEQRQRLEQELLNDDSLRFTKGDIFEKDLGMVAVIHIDGNDIGTRVRDCTTLKAYQEFSTCLTRATKDAAAYAVKNAVEKIEDRGDFNFSGSRKELPIRPIILGGDDFTVIIKAQYALEFTEDYIRKFEEITAKSENAEKLGGAMHASAGIAFVKAKSPFAANYSLCEELCSHAKNVLRERGKNNNGAFTPSAIAFHRVTTTAIPKWSQIRTQELESAYPNEKQKNKLSALYASPYLVNADDAPEGFFTMEDLKTLVEQMKNLPRGPLRQWVQQAQSDHVRAKQRWERFEKICFDNANKKSKKALQICKDIWGKNTFRIREEGTQQQLDGQGSWNQVTPILDCLHLRSLEGKEKTR